MAIYNTENVKQWHERVAASYQAGHSVGERETRIGFQETDNAGSTRYQGAVAVAAANEFTPRAANPVDAIANMNMTELNELANRGKEQTGL